MCQIVGLHELPRFLRPHLRNRGDARVQKICCHRGGRGKQRAKQVSSFLKNDILKKDKVNIPFQDLDLQRQQSPPVRRPSRPPPAPPAPPAADHRHLPRPQQHQRVFHLRRRRRRRQEQPQPQPQEQHRLLLQAKSKSSGTGDYHGFCHYILRHKSATKRLCLFFSGHNSSSSGISSSPAGPCYSTCSTCRHQRLSGAGRATTQVFTSAAGASFVPPGAFFRPLGPLLNRQPKRKATEAAAATAAATAKEATEP